MRLLPLARAGEAVDGAAVTPGAASAEELGGASTAGGAGRVTTGGGDPAFVGDDAAPEVGGVELHTPDGFVDCAQLGEGEGGADEGGGDAGALELDADALDGVGDDLAMVEGEGDLL